MMIIKATKNYQKSVEMLKKIDHIVKNKTKITLACVKKEEECTFDRSDPS